MKKELITIRIKSIESLCHHLGTNPLELEKICSSIDSYYKRFTKIKNGKVRPIAEPIGRLRSILDRLQALLQRISLPQYIHGGRKKHSNITNAESHVNKPMVLKIDLKDFFPSIKSHKVYDLFCTRLECSPDVGRLLTRLTTLDGAVPQGSPTSTILSALIIEKTAKRINSMAGCHGARYDQYVDDSTLSGPVYIKKFSRTIDRIVHQAGFAVNPKKTIIMPRSTEQVVTGVRVNSKLDAPSEMIKKTRAIIEQLLDRQREGLGVSKKEIRSVRGKIAYITRLNKGAGKFLFNMAKKLSVQSSGLKIFG
ncbi:MAG TPA: reverse transcriptase family protein [Candidatus Deferrimicrobiaceae bacterium]